jgi:membrane protease YdiL (CAAX protease family)
MNCNLIRIFTALIFVIIAFAFSPLADSLTYYNASEPFARLFQILFFLFIISPPLMVVMLYLIWKELKTRRKMK